MNLAERKQLAVDLCGQGNYREALQHLGDVCSSNPQDSESLYLLGGVYLQLRDFAQAELCFRRLVALHPDNSLAHYSLGMTVGAIGKVEEALRCMQQTLRLDPENIDARVKLGAIHQLLGQHYEAVNQYQQVLRRAPRHREAQIRLGDVHLNLGNLDKAKAFYRKALAAQPNDEDAAAGLAAVSLRQAQYEEAYRTIRPILERGTNNVSIAVIYADVCQQLGRCEDAIGLLAELLGSSTLPADGQIKVLFALGKVNDRMGHYEQAFRYYRQGNELAPFDFDPWEERKSLERFLDFWSPEYLARAPRSRKQNKRKRPVLIVGMPRSGTSLVEQILDSHPAVHGAGELQDIYDLTRSLPQKLGDKRGYPFCLHNVNQATIDSLSKAYVKKLESLSDAGAAVVTDKMPSNFRHLGLIQLLLPKAKVIHCTRNPLDTCLSCYFQDFSGAHPYSYDLENLGQYYRLYERLMRHWRDVLDLKIMDVSYEELTSDPETVSRQLVEFCGLKWDDRCLEFYKTSRAVATSSYDQVSQPIYKGSVERWRHYEQYLEPLRKALQR